MQPASPPVKGHCRQPTQHVCDISCGIIYDDCPHCWVAPPAPVPPPERAGPDHILDALAADLGRLLGESVEDAHAAFRPGEPLPAILRDVRHRRAGRVLLALAERVLAGPLREAVKQIDRETMVEELPGALAALELLPEDDASIVADGDDDR